MIEEVNEAGLCRRAKEKRINHVRDLYATDPENEPGWYAVRELFERNSCIAQYNLLTQLEAYCSCRIIGDIALVLYAIGYNGDDMLSTIKVPKEFPEKWGTDADTAFDEALLNTFATRPPRLYFTIQECVDPPYERGAFMALGADYHIPGPAVSPTLSTFPNTNGAIAIFYPGVQHKLAKVMGGSYYIAFTSIHEARLHLKGSKSPREIIYEGILKPFPEY